MKNYFTILLLLIFSTASIAQRVLTEQEAVDLALRNRAIMKVSELQVIQSRQLQRTAFNLPSLDVVAESPTGTFYPIGALQTLDFPTVYFKQHQLQKQVTVLSEKGKTITQQDPVATVILGGLVSRTLLDMIVTPVVFYKFGEKALSTYFKNVKTEELTTNKI